MFCSEKSFLERHTDEDAATGALATCLRVLKESHKRFFAAVDKSSRMMIPDIRPLLAEIRSEILMGCCIVFSRIIPKDVKPDSHPAWAIACQMGATCVEDMSDAVTHVISAGNTSKTEWALKHGKYVVSIDWLLESGMSHLKMINCAIDEDKIDNHRLFEYRFLLEETA
jgi:RNA polymerase II C-terminal domain phosphatase-like 3/4